MVAETPTETFTPGRQPQPRSRAGNSPAVLSDPARLSRFLGWFSLGLGAAELMMPRRIAKITGTRKREGLVRFYGMREIAAGVGIFTGSNPAPFLWARVAGDVVDLASLVNGSKKGRRLATAGSIAAVAGVTALDILCAQKMSQAGRQPSTERAEASIVIGRSPEECYRFWRELTNLPRFIPELRSVQISGERQSHWTAQLPGANTPIEWDAEITEDIPNQRISWRATRTPALTLEGSVSFESAPAGRGAFVRTQMDFDHPGRTLLSPAARLTGKHPEQVMYKSLRRLKQLMETGEVITTEGQPAGRRGATTWLDAIAR